MKRLVILVLLALMIAPAAEARRRETPEEIERKTRHYSGWEWGLSGRFSLIYYELERMRVDDQLPVRAFQSQAKLGGNVMLNAGYFLNNHWKLGVEAGAQIQYNGTVVPIYATAHYYYGTRKNCLFNFLNLGTNVLFDDGLRFGTTCAGGIGFRFQSPDSSHKIDVMLGYQALLTMPRPVVEGNFSYDRRDLRRQQFNQSVFIGLGFTF